MKIILSILFVFIFAFAAFGQSSCFYQLPRSIPNFTASGGSYTFDYTPSDPRCKVAFDRYNTFDWISASVLPTQISNSITITVAPNTQTARAQDAIFRVTSDAVNGGTQSFAIAVSQDAGQSPTPTPQPTPQPSPTPTPTPTCTFQLGTTSQTFTYTGGSGLIDIITQTGCAYTATNSDSFVTLQKATGTGNGTINFDIAANPGGATRTTTITIQGQIFTVNQSAQPAKTRKSRIRAF